MKNRPQDQEKPNAGWFGGCHSAKSRLLMPDSQYVWGVNIICRGGIIQSRPGYNLALSLPPGNLQGVKIFKPTKEDKKVGHCIVFSVDGKVYYSEFPLTQPTNWEPFRLKNIQFRADAQRIYFCVGQKSAASSANNKISVVSTYSVLMMQDGITAAAYYDGLNNGHLDENPPLLQTPRGTWMAWSGNRLWVARGNLVLAGDIDDPLSFKERVAGTTSGDFRFFDEITGLGPISDETRTSNLAVFTVYNTSVVLSSILDRTTWSRTANFQTEIFPDTGCVSGLSIINFEGLLWWYSQNGLVSVDSAAAAFLSSQVKYRDIEMAFSKRNFAPDLSTICAAKFENCLLMSVPSGDTLNAHTMVMDSAISNELNQDSPPAWNGVWTGTRPVQWASDVINGQRRLFQATVDYQSITTDGSFNHIWEAFHAKGFDTYQITDSNNAKTTVKNRVYSSFESKLLGDGMDLKRFSYAEVDAVEIGGDVDVKVSFSGTKGAYHLILAQHLIATIDPTDSKDPNCQELYNRVGPFLPQSRRLKTQEPKDSGVYCDGVESKVPEWTDKAFSLFIEWCGQFGVEAFRIYTDPVTEEAGGTCSEDEEGIKVLTQDGESFKFNE